ncbi:MAG TPA: 5-(carboxyamino)imidazole ribonucleotide synthase, partial [Ignavibacteriales bacterium]|nr:5-(carboxyamino)imidazole ribonucleotide synthase [Ignavibacteriales bacterium]
MNKRKKIGILGGGQLARMTAFEAYKLGFDVAIMEKEHNSPAGQLTHYEYTGWVDNNKLLQNFADDCDIVTLENEFIDYTKLEIIERLGKKVYPTSQTIKLVQDKLIQKNTFKNAGIPTPEFCEVSSENDYPYIKDFLGTPFILKSRKMGYDGYGNAFIKDEAGFVESYKKLTERHSGLMAEKYVEFKMELAVMIAQSSKEIAVYPVVQTIQKNHICHIVIAPAEIDNAVMEKARDAAIQCVKAVNGRGIFGIEMFLTQDDEILVNEIAPRPHNSGHYTIEACYTSQFENCIRAVLDLPLGSTEMVKPCAVMVNLLGKKDGEGIIENYESALSDNMAHLHIYGKRKSRIGRKMGHLT